MSTKTNPSRFRIELAAEARLPFSRAFFTRFITRVLKALNIKQGHFSFLFVEDPAMRRWHKRLFNDASTTDVLSLEDEASSQDPLGVAGDVIVCLGEAKRQAKRLKIDFLEEVLRYALHGLLHTLGYDDMTPSKKKLMWQKQERLLARYGKPGR